MQDKTALITNPAGMRLIAQMTLYNAGKWDRLRQFIAESYAAPLLEAHPAESRLDVWRGRWSQIGRLRVAQVLALDKYHVVVLMESEQGSAFQAHDLTVEEDHPHKITAYHQYDIG